jgi:hypothetical protein
MKSRSASLSALCAFLAFASVATAESTSNVRISAAEVIRMASGNGRGDFPLPGAWAGVWSLDESEYDCTTNDFLGGDSFIETLCTGQQLDFVIGAGGLDCVLNEMTDTNINFDCTLMKDLGGCIYTLTVSLVAQRTGDTFTATITRSEDFDPDTCSEDSCVRTETVANRIAPEPPDCTSAVEPETWGRVKALYR